MSSPAVTVEPDAPLAAAARLMRRGGVKWLPVIATLTRGVEGVMDVESSLTFRFDDRGVQPPKEQRHV